MEAVKKFENWAAPIVLILAAILLVWLVVKAKGLGSMLHRPSKFRTFNEFWIIFVPSMTSNLLISEKKKHHFYFQVQSVFGLLLR
jgi:cytosine/uracil/thiamine/allantoin permease